MENELLQGLEVAPNAVLNLVITAVILFALPIVYVVLWKRKCGERVSLKPLLFGVVGFLVSARVLELGVHMVCIVSDNPISRFINGSTPAYVIYGTLMAGIFEECGRYIVIRFIMKKHKTRENMVMYGIGHGGIEVWAITLVSVLSMLAVVVVMQKSGIDSALQLMRVSADSPENVLNSAAAAIKSAASINAAAGAMNVLERILAMSGHIALTVIVAYGVLKSEKKYLPIAILTHAGFDVFPALYQRGVVGMWTAELWLIFCVALLVLWSRGLYRRLEGPDIA